MEDVLEWYRRPYDPCVPVVCMDERPVQLVKETRVPLPPQRRRPRRVDYEYERAGTACVFVFTEALRGWRRVTVRPRRTAVDWAHEVRTLLDQHYPDADRVILVCDNLNTHKIASFYEAFPPAEARRLAERIDIHYTCRDRPFTGGPRTSDRSLARSLPGTTTETTDSAVSTGSSRRKMLAPNSRACILLFKCHEALAAVSRFPSYLLT